MPRSVPCRSSTSKGRAFGAMLFERSAAEPFDGHTVELCDSVAALLGPILEEKRKNDRLLIAKVRDSLVGPRSSGYSARVTPRERLVAVSLRATHCVSRICQGPIPGHRGDHTGGTGPARGRGTLSRIHLRGSWSAVETPWTKGQTMCSLDVRDLRVEYSRGSSERETVHGRAPAGHGRQRPRCR